MPYVFECGVAVYKEPKRHQLADHRGDPRATASGGHSPNTNKTTCSCMGCRCGFDRMKAQNAERRERAVV